MRKNKKAWLRIVEAFIAIILIAGILLTVYVRTPERDNSKDIHNTQRAILEQISRDDVLRIEILDEAETEKTQTKEFIKKLLPVYLNFSINVCEMNVHCPLEYEGNIEDLKDKDIYAEDILISSTLNNPNPRKLKLFFWRK